MGTSLILSDLGTEIIIPVCALVGIVFSLFQWFLVSKVKLSLDGPGGKNAFTESLIEEEEGINDHNVVQKCAEIQNAISEGATSFLLTEYKYSTMYIQHHQAMQACSFHSHLQHCILYPRGCNLCYLWFSWNEKLPHMQMPELPLRQEKVLERLSLLHSVLELSWDSS
ncbi:unnamed protein product [Lactuca virosa]|uniref:H(+)-exporting diphosphatase n=1 Tax=Lactuca virosa TaxID=75947 RepID=A0AAU9PG30_9ASTR|nr:unnamed protein product [Lactuca virosa]